MTDEKLQAIRQRAEAATPGPWYEPDDETWGTSRAGDIYAQTDTLGNLEAHNNTHVASVAAVANEKWQDNAQFIAHAREDIPALLAEVERLREIVQAVAEQRKGAFGTVRDVVLCYDDNADRLECPWCYGHEVKHGSEHGFEHAPDCPVTKARALLKDG